jgi:hypothetical protein
MIKLEKNYWIRDNGPTNAIHVVMDELTKFAFDSQAEWEVVVYTRMRLGFRKLLAMYEYDLLLPVG